MDVRCASRRGARHRGHGAGHRILEHCGQLLLPGVLFDKRNAAGHAVFSRNNQAYARRHIERPHPAVRPDVRCLRLFHAGAAKQSWILHDQPLHVCRPYRCRLHAHTLDAGKHKMK